MAVLTVPQQFSTIAAAAAAASPGDTIQVAAGYAGNETVTIAVNGLIVDAPAGVAEVQLTLGTGVSTITLSGAAEITVRGNGGANVITGNAGSNVLRGNAGNDTIDGGAEADWADYSFATGTVQVALTDAAVLNGATGGASAGADGVDTLISIERLRGSAFDDVLTGNSGDNFIRGNAGNDRIDGGAGFDFADYNNAAAAVQVTLTNAAATGGPSGGVSAGGDGADTLIAIEHIRGSAFADTLTGNGGINILRGGLGNDSLDGAGGRDAADYVNATGAVSVSLSNAVNGRSGGTASGADGNDTLFDIEDIRGSDFADVLIGNNAANTLFGRGGNDQLDGREGIDSASFGFNRTTYSVTRQGNAALTVSNTGTGDTDSLQNIERLVFLDGILAFDIDAPAGPDGLAGVAYRLYQAAFGRTPDVGGLSFWAKQLDDGKTDPINLAARFIDTPEFQALYGSRQPATTEFLTKIYQNVLGRAPDQGGFAFWSSRLDGGTLNQAQVLASFSDSAENRALVAPAIAGGVFFSSDYFLY